jgi:hypothetical protein
MQVILRLCNMEYTSKNGGPVNKRVNNNPY